MKILVLSDTHLRLGRVVAVRGNTDEPALREILPDRTVFEAGGRKIDVAHGWGAP